MQNLLKKGHRKIARLLERSTISREYKKFGAQEDYNYRKAHKITVDNYKRNPFKITQNDFLRNLKNYDYIGQISNELKETFGVNKELNVSKETIYIYIFCKGELKKELREIKVSTK